jgi:periplasmic protein TonB
MSQIRKKKHRIGTLDDIVFENRNKAYGCYYLRSTSRRRLLISAAWAFSIFIITILTVFLVEIEPFNKRFNQSELVSIESIHYDHDMVTLLSQLSEIQPDQSSPTQLALEPKPISAVLKGKIERKTVPVIELKPILPKVDTSKSRLVDDLLRKHESQVKRMKSTQTDSLSMFIEKVPQFPGGYTAVQAYFYKNQHYPENALIHGIHGSAVVSFVVNTNGGIEKASVVKGIDPDLDQEAIRLVKTMPRWQPAYSKGKPIASMLIMPVNFTIK